MNRLSFTLSLIILLLMNSCSQNIDRKDEIDKKQNLISELIDSLQNHESNSAEIDSSLIIVDTISKLVWMKNDFGLIKNRYINEWIEIFEYKDEINSANYAGFNDWRVPTITEYRTLNHNRKDRKTYRILFNELDTINVWGKGAYAFWSKSTPNKNTASYISFIDGFATSGNKGEQLASGPWKGIIFAMSVRLVRN